MLKALAVLVGLTGAAQAQQCIPLETYSGLAKEVNAKLVTADGDQFVKDYNAALGFTLPADSDPIGMIFVIGDKSVLIAIVEREGCVKYAANVPLHKHQTALRGV